MPEPTNPRKKALMPAGPLRKKLRAAGHHLTPIVQVGKEGVSDAVLRQLDQALVDHELVKVKVGTETPEDRFEAAERLGAGSEAQLAQILGRTVLLYRKHPDKPKFEAKTERAERKPAREAKEPRGRATRGGRANAARPRAPKEPARRRRG
jgi:RNA-binding protein